MAVKIMNLTDAICPIEQVLFSNYVKYLEEIQCEVHAMPINNNFSS